MDSEFHEYKSLELFRLIQYTFKKNGVFLTNENQYNELDPFRKEIQKKQTHDNS